MNSFLNITIRVLANGARTAVKGVQAEMAALRAETVATNASSAAFGAGVRANILRMNRWGGQIQWTGRQLQRNWTIPLLLAGGAALKFALEQEKSFTHVQKVYGDGAAAADYFRKHQELIPEGMTAVKAASDSMQGELDALGKAFTAISEHFGVNRKEVLDVAGAWAQAGKSGLDLARSVNLTMKAMLLGDMESAKATQALISIQAQYRQSNKELNQTLAELNIVADQTGIELSGLIEGFQRSAGVAMSTGVGVRELAAELAALVPAAGTASQAGNALKTIYSRLVSPTQDIQDIIGALNIDLRDHAWVSATAVERLQILNKRFSTLSDTEKAVAASTVGSRWQYNKLVILLQEMSSKTGFYAKALEATKNKQDAFKHATLELNAILESSPNKFARIWAAIQNGMASAIIPLIPYLLYLFDLIRQGITWFQGLDPRWQKFIMFASLALAVLPLLVIYVGSFVTLITTMGRALLETAVLLGGFAGSIMKVFAFLTVKPLMFFVSQSMAALAFLWSWTLKGSVLTGTRMIQVSIFFWTRTAAIWLWGAIASAGAVTGVFTAMIGTVNLIMAAVWLGMKTWLVKIALAIMSFGARFEVIWARALYVMETAFVAFREFIFVQAAVLRGGLSMLWVGMYMGLTKITVLFSGAITKLWGILSVGLLNITAWLGGRMMVLWTAMHAGLMAISRAFWTAMTRGWIIAATALMRAPALILAGLRIFAARILPILFGPWGLLVAAILAVVGAFGSQIATLWNNIVTYFSDSSNGMVQAVVKAWYSLPLGIRNALVAVVRIVQQAALQVYEWLSYLNPFAHHSPSLVENVTNGIAEVNRQFSKLSVGGAISKAYAEVKKFGELTRGLGVSAEAKQRKDDRKALGGASPAALASYNRLVKLLDILNPKLDALQVKVDAQQRVVDKWQSAVDRANYALDQQQNKLDKLQSVADKWKDKIDSARDTLEHFASAPIAGMKAMSDAIFENEMQTKTLQLQMLKYQDVNGTLDDMKSKLDAINGAQELLRGQQADLRSAGAGSDILSGYTQQIDALEEQKKAIVDVTKPLMDMQHQLDELQRQGQILDLTNSLQFDPLTHQIEAAANAMQELPFDQIMAGIQAAQADISNYTDEWTIANQAVQAQQGVVDGLTASRDKLQARLDREQHTLNQLQARYDKINNAIQAINNSISDVISNSQKLGNKKGAGGAGDISPALQAFRDAKGGNFPDVGGSGTQIRKDWSSEADAIQKFTDEMSTSTADMFADINPFGPIKKKAGEFFGWLKARWNDLKAGFADMGSSIFGGGIKSDIGDKLSTIWNKVKSFGSSMKKLFGPDVKRAFDGIKDAGKDLWKELGPEIKRFAPLFKDFLKGFKIVAVFMGGVFLFSLKVIASTVSHILGPALTGIIKIVANVLQVIRGFANIIIGIIKFVVAILKGDWAGAWEAVKQGFHGVYDVFAGTFGAIGHLIAGVVNVVLNVIGGFVGGIVNFFKWLWDVLVGHSIVPDIVHGIVRFFRILIAVPKWIWNNVLKPIYQFFIKVWSDYIKPFLASWWDKIKSVWNALTTIARWVWDHILKPVWNTFQDAFVKIKSTVQDGKEKIVEKFQAIKDKVGDVIDFIKGMPGKIKDLGGDMLAAGKHIMEKLFDGMRAVGGVVSDIAGSIWHAVANSMNSAIDRINDAIPDKIGKGKLSIDLPNDPFPHVPTFYTGGIVRGSRAGMLAILGDRGHDEAVIPLSGPYAPKMRSGQIGSGSGGRVININGNLEFPNIRSSSDAEEFIKNLEILASA